ncbi:MAG: hypothetical protein FWD49_05950 [Firmicutes bacterium]|nr:hypothetical protein [Bacillota bacterium]
MVLRKSLAVLADNIGLAMKILVYSAVLILCCVLVMNSIVAPLYRVLMGDFALLEQIRESLSLWIESEGGSQSLWAILGSFYREYSSQLLLSLVWFGLVYFAVSFFVNLTTIPIIKILHNKMSQSYNERFYFALVSSLSTSLFYSLIHSLIALVIDLIIGAFAVLLIVWLRPLGFFAFTLAFIVALALFALRNCLFSQWAPTIISENKGVLKAFKDSFKNSIKSLKLCFVPYLVAGATLFAVITTTGFLTFGVMPVFFLPVFMVFLSCVSLTSYFTLNNKKFYIYKGKVDDPEEQITDSE